MNAKRVGVLLGLLIAITGASAIWIANQPDPSELPSNIAEKISYPVFYPVPSEELIIDQSKIDYNANNELLSFVVESNKYRARLYFNQQPTPESFIDIPQAYEKLITSLQPYSSFETFNGKVTLTKPLELKGAQSAVVNSKGTLMFIRTDKDLSPQQWKELFNSLTILKPKS